MGRYSRFAVYGASDRMCSATATWPSFRSAFAFASNACTSAADVNIFIAAASVCAAGAWSIAVDAAAVTDEDAAGRPAITTTAATSASTRLIPRVRIVSSPYRDFRFDFPDGHTYTPEGPPRELKMIYISNLSGSSIVGN